MDKKAGKKKSNLITFIVFIVLLVAAGLVIYYQYMHKQQIHELDKTPTTETEKLIAKDLEIGYPETPVEVMKLWGRLNMCVYNSALDEAQFASLLDQMRMLYSKELLEQNQRDVHQKRLQEEVSEFQGNKNKIVSYSADTGTSTVYKQIQGRDSAKVRVSYFINRGGTYVKQFQEYILVKEDQKWKILGFQEESTEQKVSKQEALKQ